MAKQVKKAPKAKSKAKRVVNSDLEEYQKMLDAKAAAGGCVFC